MSRFHKVLAALPGWAWPWATPWMPSRKPPTASPPAKTRTAWCRWWSGFWGEVGRDASALYNRRACLGAVMIDRYSYVRVHPPPPVLFTHQCRPPWHTGASVRPAFQHEFPGNSKISGKRQNTCNRRNLRSHWDSIPVGCGTRRVWGGVRLDSRGLSTPKGNLKSSPQETRCFAFSTF